MKADVNPRPNAIDASGLANGDVMLAVSNVSLSFGGVKAIRDVSLDIRKGEIRAIIGPNGAGKTSMLNVINGFYHPQQGTIAFKGRERRAMRPYIAASQGIARTFQNVALFRGMTALDNIMAGRTLKMHRGLFWQMLRFGPALAEEVEHRKRVEEIIDFLHIEHIRKVPVGRLPYGLQKRVELGRALAMEPDLLLLDEPMAGMNLEEKEDMSRFIVDVNTQYGTTIALTVSECHSGPLAQSVSPQADTAWRTPVATASRGCAARTRRCAVLRRLPVYYPIGGWFKAILRRAGVRPCPGTGV